VDSLRAKKRRVQAKVSGKRRKEVTKECLMEAILHPANLQTAIEAVRRNKGCAGIDGKSIAETERYWQQHWPTIEAKLRSGTYVPTPLMGIKYLKRTGEKGCWGFQRYKSNIKQQYLRHIAINRLVLRFA
jgi:hypothetical protein